MKSGTKLLLAIVLAAGAGFFRAGLIWAAEAPLPATIEFNRDVRPILSDNCFFCHGPDPKHRKADLRLDLRDEAVTSEAIVPGKPEESELVEADLSQTIRRADAAGRLEQEADGAAERDSQALDRAGRRVPAALGLRDAGKGDDSSRSRRRRYAGAPAAGRDRVASRRPKPTAAR